MTTIPNYPVVDGSVRDVEISNDVLYIGGDFSYAGVANGLGGVASLSNNQLLSYPLVGGTEVSVSISDGNGGFYIGGSFLTVGGESRVNLAHIEPGWVS